MSSLGSFFDRSEISSAFAGLAAAVSVAVMFKKDIRCRYKSYRNVKTRKLGIVQAGISGREQNRRNVIFANKRPPPWETSLHKAVRRVDLTPFAQVPTRLVNPISTRPGRFHSFCQVSNWRLKMLTWREDRRCLQIP